MSAQSEPEEPVAGRGSDDDGSERIKELTAQLGSTRKESVIPEPRQADVDVEDIISYDMYFTTLKSIDVHDPIAAERAAKQLVHIGAPAVPALITALTSPNTDVARGARDTLIRIGGPAFDSLIAANRPR